MSTKETATTPATPMNSKAPSNAVSSAKSGGIGHSSDAEESELPGYQWDESIFVSLLAADFSQEDFQKLERNLNDIALLNRMVEVFHKTKAQKAEISRLEERLSLMTKLLGESYGMMPVTTNSHGQREKFFFNYPLCHFRNN